MVESVKYHGLNFLDNILSTSQLFFQVPWPQISNRFQWRRRPRRLLACLLSPGGAGGDGYGGGVGGDGGSEGGYGRWRWGMGCVASP